MIIRAEKANEGLEPGEMVKKESVEEAVYEWPPPVESPQSVDDNLTLAQFSNTILLAPTPLLSYQGHRSNKSQEGNSQTQTKKKKKKQLSACKSNHVHVIPDVAGMCGRAREKIAINGLDSPDQAKSPVMVRAEEVRLSLGSESPSFLKLLVRSHVNTGFWMSLPVPFCKSHLPMNDTTVTLEDEDGEQFELKYIADKTGLSAGWKKFAVGHKLLEGDVLVFHLVGPNKLKVYIIRANDLTEVDGALSLLNLDAHKKQNDTGNEQRATILRFKKRKRPKSLSLTVVEKKNKKSGLSSSVPQFGQLVEQSGNDSEEVGSEVLEGSKLSGPTLRFKDIKRFEDFHIHVNGLCIDSDLPKHMRMKYYELCCSRKAYLHENLLPGLYSKLAAGMIGETVNIADALRACKFTTSWNEFAIWEKSLKSFVVLGMNVGFLRKRVRRLLGLAFESEGASETKRYIEAKNERTRTEDEIKNLEAKLVELREASERFDADIETLKSKAERYEIEFQEEINAPW